MRKALRYALVTVVWFPVYVADRLRGINPPVSFRRGMEWARGEQRPAVRTAAKPAVVREPGQATKDFGSSS